MMLPGSIKPYSQKMFGEFAQSANSPNIFAGMTMRRRATARVAPTSADNIYTLIPFLRQAFYASVRFFSYRIHRPLRHRSASWRMPALLQQGRISLTSPPVATTVQG